MTQPARHVPCVVSCHRQNPNLNCVLLSPPGSATTTTIKSPSTTLHTDSAALFCPAFRNRAHAEIAGVWPQPASIRLLCSLAFYPPFRIEEPETNESCQTTGSQRLPTARPLRVRDVSDSNASGNISTCLPLPRSSSSGGPPIQDLFRPYVSRLCIFARDQNPPAFASREQRLPSFVPSYLVRRRMRESSSRIPAASQPTTARTL